MNETDTRRIGDRAEKLAAKYLKKAGYRILEKNLRTRLGEIDILARKDNVLVVVEVKGAQNESEFGAPIFRVDAAKRRKLRRLAGQLIQRYNLRATDIRFDVVTVDISKGLQGIDVVENAF